MTWMHVSMVMLNSLTPLDAQLSTWVTKPHPIVLTTFHPLHTNDQVIMTAMLYSEFGL